MAFVRMLVSWGPPDAPVADRFSNTLYFNVAATPVGWNAQSLCDDLRTIYAARSWTTGAKVEVRAYNMADAKPRPEIGYSTTTVTGTWKAVAPQVAVALSYYADRNLPRRRGRIYTGPWVNADSYVSTANRTELITFANALAGLGGVDVDWSVYSPTTAAGGDDGHWRISNVWVDNSWDVIRSRKLKGTARSTATING